MEENKEKKTVEGEENNGTEQPKEQPANNAAPATAEQPKETLIQKAKKHWKGLTAAGVGILGLALSARAAYKRGKAAAVTYEPEGQPDDYTLNPNNE